VERSGKRTSLFEITISEKALTEFVIWVIHSRRIASRCLLGVSLRLLSSRPIRGFIYNNFRLGVQVLLFHEEEKQEEVVGVVVGMEYLVSLADVGMQVFLVFQD
jgi:hypothetical protein